MMDLKNFIADFQKTSAYDVLHDLVLVCGIESVLSALSEIVGAEQSVVRTATRHEHLPADFDYICAGCGDIVKRRQ